ncbi:MAG: hypothetical protein WBE72_01930 [Terracidiphilus sp.]
MAVSRTLRRLLRVLNLEEEQTKIALESALGEVKRLEAALEAASERGRGGRRLVSASALSGELADRVAGLEETRAAQRKTAALGPQIEDAEQEAAARRDLFLLKRVERRQAETLIQEAEARDAIEAGRRGQQSLDDWFLNRLRHAGAEAEPARETAARRTPSRDARDEEEKPVAAAEENLRKNRR